MTATVFTMPSRDGGEGLFVSSRARSRVSTGRSSREAAVCPCRT
jgi:hypothetical protein